MITLLQRIIALVGQEAPSSRRDYRLAEYHQEAADLLLELGEKPAAVAALRAALAVEPNVEVRLALEDERGRMERSESSEPTSEV